MGKGKKLFDSNSQVITLLTLVVQFLHCLLCLSNYLDWVRHQEDKIGLRIVRLYLALTIIAIISFLLISSVFYMWAWRYASSEEAAKRRRIWGIAINLLFADFPLFCTEVDIVWNAGFSTGLQALSFTFTCISFVYSSFRVWVFTMVRVIKRSQPPRALGTGGYPGQAQGGGVLPPTPLGDNNRQSMYNISKIPYNGEASVPMQTIIKEQNSEGPEAISAALGDAEPSDLFPGDRADGIIPQTNRQSSTANDYGQSTFLGNADGIIPANTNFSRQPYNVQIP
eukprot:TRINITY_DN10184_c1_g1_i1.p1 TRINITY_DN10184_c1_g1~~TRINITY_DN10184_c1_g1_i1.p1  ORF type:complete len:282 (+),score=27.75 TRINITY_DN10184_c1_g1_i1:83-928(+)